MLMGGEAEKFTVKEGSKESFSDQTKVDYWESVYDRQDFWGVCYRARKDQALSWLDGSNLSKNSMILDVGCGTGVVTREAARRGYKVFGMDYSYSMVQKCNSACNFKEKLDVGLLQGDMESLPFKDSSFDAIVCLGVITYLKSEEKALCELSRVLKPDGILTLSILNKTHLAKYLDLPLFIGRKLQRALTGRIAPSRKRVETKKAPAPREYFIPGLRNSFKAAGLAESDRAAVPFGPLTFLGRKIFPQRINMKITMFIAKFHVPFIGSLGGMCLFKLRKGPLGSTKRV